MNIVNWDNFYIFAIFAIAFWIIGAALAWRSSVGIGKVLGWYVGGTAIIAIFIIGFWVTLGRPPLKTMGETRLWYSFFLSVTGIIAYYFWRYRWILSFSTVMATVFVMINIFKPEIHSETLMPALQSGWFVPHVTVYMFSYAFFGCTFLLALVGLVRRSGSYLPAVDNLTVAGIAFFTIGMLFGSLWAKEAWGNFWTWDPKETWAAVTWLVYLLYLHLRREKKAKPALLYVCLIVAFLSLQMCWYGINYLPAAQNSVHTYSRD